MRIVALLLVCACGKPASEPRLRKLADVELAATLVAGTRRFAIAGGETWWQSDAGDQPAIGAAVARETNRLGGVVDPFLGTTPILVGGEEHQETQLRITPAVTPIEYDGHPTKIVTLGKREAWLVQYGIADLIVFVDGTKVEEVPIAMRLGPPAETASPVSAKRCELPRVEDIVARGDELHALITECNDDTPIRIVTYPGGKVTRLPSRKELGLAFMKLAVTPDGKLHVAGIHDGRFEIAHVNGRPLQTTFGANRVQSVVAADDGAIWALVLDADAKPQLLRDGVLVPAIGTPQSIAIDEKFGVVVLVDGALYAEHPGVPFAVRAAR